MLKQNPYLDLYDNVMLIKKDDLTSHIYQVTVTVRDFRFFKDLFSELT